MTVEALRLALAADEVPPDDLELADILWLALHLPRAAEPASDLPLPTQDGTEVLTRPQADRVNTSVASPPSAVPEPPRAQPAPTMHSLESKEALTIGGS